MEQSHPTLTSWLLLALLGLIWGSSFLGVELALDGFGPVTVAAFRITLAAAILTAWAYGAGYGLPDTHTPMGRRIWLGCIGMGLFTNAIPFALLSWGQQHTTSGFAGLTMAIVPLFTLVLAHHLVPGERITWRRAIGFAIGFVGVLVLIGTSDLTESDGGLWLAKLACVGAAACYATGSIITRRTPQGPFPSFAAGGLIVATIVIVPFALLREGVPHAASSIPVLGAVYLGLFPTAFATIILVYVVRTAGPSFLSLVNYQVPVWAVLIGAVVLNEAVPPQLLWAMLLILTGAAIAQFGRRKKPVT